MLLDFNPPGMSGIEFLRWTRREQRLRGIPVAVISGDSGRRSMTDHVAKEVRVSDRLARSSGYVGGTYPRLSDRIARFAMAAAVPGRER